MRHNETSCTGTGESRPEPAEALVVKTGGKQSGPEQTGTPSPLSGPRYRGSNPCLPSRQFLSKASTCGDEALVPIYRVCGHVTGVRLGRRQLIENDWVRQTRRRIRQSPWDTNETRRGRSRPFGSRTSRLGFATCACVDAAPGCRCPSAQMLRLDPDVLLTHRGAPRPSAVGFYPLPSSRRRLRSGKFSQWD